MNTKVKTDILNVLNKVLDLLKEKDFSSQEIKFLSNKTIHNASIFQDQDSISVAVVIYSLSKIYEREGKIDRSLVFLIEECRDLLHTDYYDEYRAALKKTMKKISSIDSKLKMYLEEVLNKAQVKKGSKIYEHGISLARASELMGISQWELMSYVGRTTQEPYEKTNVKARLNFARGLFNIK